MKKRLLISLLALSGSLEAQDPGLTDTILPQVGQRGTTVEVVATGNFLRDAREVLFYQPGIRCTKFEKLSKIAGIHSKGPDHTIAAEPGTALKLTFEIAPDAPLGQHQLRIRTRDGLGELVTFWVTPFPVIIEKNPFEDTAEARNDTPEFAQPIPLNSTIAGYLPLPTPQDYDFYRVDCKSGQILTVEAVGQRLGTLHYEGMNDPALAIYDAAGKALTRNDDNSLFGADPWVSVRIPKDGAYFIEMRQQMDYENRRRHYLLHVGTWSRPGLIYPLGGQAGKRIELSLLGTGEMAKVDLMADPGPYEGAYQDIWTEGSPTPNRIHVAPFPDHFESDGYEISQELPVAINGKIETEGEVDWYRFRARKGERYRVRTYGKTLNSELDPRIWIKPAEGNPDKQTWDVDDSLWPEHDLVGHHYREQIQDRLDPIFMFEAREDGEYLLGIGDTRRQFGPEHVYRIEFQPHINGAQVFFDAYPSQAEQVRDRVVVFRGHSYARPLSIQAGFGSDYSGKLRIRALNLPDGVTIEAPEFTTTESQIPLFVRADADAETGGHLLDLVVEPVDPGARGDFRGGFVQVIPATQRRGGYAMAFHRTRKLALAVVEGAPFDLAMEPPRVGLVQSGELSLRVRVTRHEGFAGAVYCEADWLPEGVNKQPPLIIPAGTDAADYKVSARNDAKPGVYPISITGRENEVEGGSVRSAAGYHYLMSRAVNLEVSEPYLSVTLERAAIERRKTGEIVGKIKHHKSFEGEAVATLGRLPFGVRQIEPFPKIRAGDTEMRFKVEVTADCLLEQYRDIFCEVAIPVEGQVIRQQTGSGILRVDAERK
ncbi:MAG: PPC domain-containing protein [Akkermansiaceae bacterium]|nr:PPC domain-containing protein [Akkermansiaceae bacterium]